VTNCNTAICLQGKPECKKLRYGAPKYLDQMEEMFQDVIVDGSTSYIFGQDNADEEEAEELEDEPKDDPAEDPAEELQGYGCSPMSTNSRKRSSTISTKSTPSSPSRKSKA
jgi:hypothetical protein